MQLDITNEDIELYVRFLQEDSLDNKFDEHYEIYRFSEIVNAYNQPENDYEYYPWYKFFDNEMGTTYLMDLPDLRGHKERVYECLARQEKLDNDKERREEWERNQDKRPYLSYYGGDFMDKFIKEMEIPNFYRYYEEQKKWRQKRERNELAEMIIRDLDKDPRRNIAMEAGEDWRNAVKRTFERYRREHVIAFMPTAYEQYLENSGKQWNYPGEEEDMELLEDIEDFRKSTYDRIIRGRMLNGEPADLNF